MTETLTTLSGDFYVGMKLSDCKTDEQRKNFKRIAALDGKITNILSGEDICKERDNENTSRYVAASTACAAGGGLFAAGCAQEASIIGIPTGIVTQVAGAFVTGAGFICNLWNYATDRNTENYKKQHNIKY